MRADFPILTQRSNGRPLVYLDNAATTQKPRQVIDAIRYYYEADNANIHRGVYELSERASARYAEAREKVRRFINAANVSEIIFTRGTTESINLVAATFGRQHLKAGDEIILTRMEHHSNIVPWQILCEQSGAVIKVAPIDDRGELMLDEFRKLFSPRTKLVAAVHVSNSLGTINPAGEMVKIAHEHGVPVLLDGAQWVAHGKTDVQALGCDFYAFSGHKLYGPTGIGVLYGRLKLLESMPPYQGGGDMISSVTFEKTTYNDVPHKFEAGTPHIAGAIGLGAAIDYVQSIGLDAIAAHERGLLEYATAQLSQIPGLKIVGTASRKSAVVSFVMTDPPMTAIDLGVKLDGDGIAVRTGHHCCQPVMDRFGIPATVRASFAIYNTRQEVNALVESLQRIRAEAVSRPASPPRPVRTDEAHIEWPTAQADSPAAAADALAEDFEILESRDDKNQYVLDLGDRLPHTFDLLKTITTLVPGCMSQVYMVARPAPQQRDAMQFLADADAQIVRGLIAILLRLYSGQRVRDVLGFDIEAFFHRIGLDQFITSQRRNGLAGMVKRIRSLAEQIAQSEERRP